VLSRDETQALEDVAVTERDKLIVRILGDTGIRVGELVNLTTHDLINRDRNLYLRVGGKTGERLVPIPRLSRRLQSVHLEHTHSRVGRAIYHGHVT
jgi:integrase